MNNKKKKDLKQSLLQEAEVMAEDLVNHFPPAAVMIITAAKVGEKADEAGIKIPTFELLQAAQKGLQ